MRLITFAFAAVCISCVTLCGCAKKVEKVNAYKIEPNAHSAVTPVPRSDEWWTKRHQAVLDRVKQGNVNLIFIGDSITQGWEGDGKEVWDKYYAKRNAINMGFNGDHTQHVLWRFENGEIDGISPKLAVVMIGTNNSNNNDNTSKEIGEGIIAICQELRKDLPKTKILILAIFPRGEKPSPQREKNAEASRLASTIADNKWIYYLDINDKFLDKDGTLSKDIMPDYLHPNAKGYEIEAEAIEPMVKKLMAAPN
jgi:lysophospholipase L1-like esterase